MIRIKLKDTDQSFEIEEDLVKRFGYIISNISFDRRINQDFLSSIFDDGVQILEITDSDLYEKLEMVCKNLVYFVTSTNMDDYFILNYLGYTGALYDPVYLAIYNEEKQMRHIEGLDGCFDLSKVDFSDFNFEIDDFAVSRQYKTRDDTPNVQETEEKFSKISPDFNQILESKYEMDNVVQPHVIGLREEQDSNARGYLNKILAKFNREDLPFITLAGGSVLKSFNQEPLGLSDVDVFFHSCSKEKAYEIIYDFAQRNGDYITSSPNTVNVNINARGIVAGKAFVEVQFILRLYNSPSEIILGFDVDSSCILYDSIQRKYYGTKRFVYAHLHKMNTVNFDRMSPSYEFRLKKFVRRGYGIYIPGYEILTRSLVLDQDLYTGANVLLNFIVRKFGKKVVDYEYRIGAFTNGIPSIEEMVFKVQDPGEQAMGTFHRLVYDNPQEWYGNAETLPEFKVPELDNSTLHKYSLSQILEERESVKNCRYKNVLRMSKTPDLKVTDFINSVLCKCPRSVVAVGVSAKIPIDKLITDVNKIFAIVGSDNFVDDYNHTMLAIGGVIIDYFYREMFGIDVVDELGMDVNILMNDCFISRRNVVEYREGDSEQLSRTFDVGDRSVEIDNLIDNALELIDARKEEILNGFQLTQELREEIERLDERREKIMGVSRIYFVTPRVKVSMVNYRTMEQLMNHQEMISNKIIMVGSPEGGEFYMGELTKSSIVNQINYEPLDDLQVTIYRRSFGIRYKFGDGYDLDRQFLDRCKENSYGYIVDRKEYITKALNHDYGYNGYGQF